jgi:hypothetical protein
MTNNTEKRPELTVETARDLVSIALASAVETHPAIIEVKREIEILPKLVRTDLISGQGMRTIGKSESHEEFARALVEEAFRDLPEISAEVIPVRQLPDPDVSNSQFAISA